MLRDPWRHEHCTQLADMPEDRENETSDIVVRTLREADLEDIVRIDAKVGGTPRRDYYKKKVARALLDTSVQISLAAELEGRVVGFLLGSVYYGDFGQPEAVATIDAVGVAPDAARRGVGRALFLQLVRNLKGMRVERIETQVDFSNSELLLFFQRMGFIPSRRLSLEKALDPTELEG
ncbi:MAG: GNAT family N-acetyltransferase [Deltaproteobacteria bacterium]|nr:GNAT family N-acetyltransferase [Deltaproteobacteria bacterium]